MAWKEAGEVGRGWLPQARRWFFILKSFIFLALERYDAIHALGSLCWLLCGEWTVERWQVDRLGS